MKNEIKTFLKALGLFNFLKKTEQDLSQLFNFIANIGLALRHQHLESSELKQLNCDVQDDRFSRYLYLFLLFLTESGYQVNLRFRYDQISQLGTYSRRILKLPRVRLVWRQPGMDELKLTDRLMPNSILLSDDYFGKGGPNSFYVPYTLHPNAYSRELHLVNKQKDQIRTVLCYFSGNTDPLWYNNPCLNDLFGVYTRLEVIKYLRTRLNFVIDRFGDHNSGDIVLQDSVEVGVSLDKYWSELATSNFFLALPGVVMPLCHNVIEAMAVNTIPIIQFPERFCPPLTDQVNCLSFDTMDDLCEILVKIKSFSEEKMSELRLGVNAYYVTYLEPEVVVINLELALPKLKTVYLNAEYASVEKLRARKLK